MAQADNEKHREEERPERVLREVNNRGGQGGGETKRIVLFADGTGNAFTNQESSVWRLYDALDRTQPDQVAYYIKGVGTASWRPLAALDGATGIGVPANVRKLYRFLCWVWEPGDEIYVFGFSRGSFTGRTLVGLIAAEGLVPAAFDGVTVSHAEMQRNAMAAWRAYRKKSALWTKCLPTIWIARVVRDGLLAVYHRLRRHRPYAEVCRQTVADGRDVIPIKFVGLFDTVEAFGVPIEELRGAIDWAIWPISFRNHVLSDGVARACHALSLDDERTTFHPIRFDRSSAKDRERIQEVWFAGVHSDIGGGYPDATLAFVPLVWMAEHVEAELRFQPGRIDRFRSYASPMGPLHDSRAGLSVFYRYDPRPIEVDKAAGGPPVVHHSVVERMQRGCDNYAPVMLPASARVLMPDGQLVDMTNAPARAALATVLAAPANKSVAKRTTAALHAVTSMPPPDPDMVEQTLDTVWWRRVAYFALLWTVALLVAWPFIGPAAVDRLSGVAALINPGNGQAAAWLTGGLSWISAAAEGVQAVAGSTLVLLGHFVPSYFSPWLETAENYPVSTVAVAGLAIAVWRVGIFLRDRIQERARLAWNRPGRKISPPGVGGRLLAVAHRMRTIAAAKLLHRVTTGFVVPGTFLAALFFLVLVGAGRSYFNWRAGSGDICRDEEPTIAVATEPTPARGRFDTASLCWATGLTVEKDHKYRIWIAIKDPWFDRTIMSGVNGFQFYGVLQLVALPSRRWIRAEWFQPILRIGGQGTAEMPLASLDAAQPDRLPRRRAENGRKIDRPIQVEDTPEFADPTGGLRRRWPNFDAKFGSFEPLKGDALAAAREIWSRQDLARLMVADFVATESGELFLYVNDAIQVFPFFGPFQLYYGNNSGTAEVHVLRLPLPPP